ncbi:MAG: VWA domain-containing protein, partial [Planctomycetota bacterium]
AAAAGTPTLTVIRMNLHLPPLKVSQAKKRPETLKSTGAGAIPCDKGDKLTYNFEVVAGNYAMKTGYLPATSEKLIWKKIRPGTAGKQVSAIAVSGSTAETPASTPTAGTSAENYSDMVLVGYANGEVWLSKDTNVPNAELSGTRPTWTSMNVAVNRYCTRVLIDPKDENVLFACFGGFAAGNLQMSTDQGDTWSSISEGLPNAPVHCLAVHPDNSNWLYAGTEVGLFASEDRGATWAVSNEGPASVAVSDMFWMGTTLVAVTFGRGVFQIDIPIHKKAKAILFGDTDGALVEIAQDSSDSNTGHVVRSEFLAENVELLSPMLAIHNTTTLKDTFGTTLAEKLKNTVFAGGSSGSLYWNDIATLESNWNSAKKLDGSIFARPELWHEPESESLSIVVTDNKGFLHGFDLATGNEALMKINVCQLKDEETVEVYSNEVVDNWAYVATSKGLYGVRLVGDQPGVEFKKDGSEDKSDADAGEESAFPTTHRVPPLIAGQMIFAASEDEDGNGTLSAFDARTGKQRWSNECCYRPCQPVWALGAVVVAGEGELVAYHHESGKELVRQQCGIVESLSADDCMLYFVAGDELCKWQLKPARDTWSIEKLQSAKVPMGSQYAPLVVDQEIYVLGIDANVRCFKSTATGLKEMWTCETYGTPAHTAAIPIFEQVTPDEKKPATHAPKGAEVALALDVSGSMKGRPLASLKRATQKLIYMLHPYDSLGIATFNHQAKCAWGDGGNTRGLDYHFDKNDAADAVQQIRAGGGTNIGLGLEQASEMLGTKSNPSSKAVVLLSDGKNHPEGLPPDEMWVRGKLEDAKIAIYTVALGAEADHAMLEKIAGRRNAHVAHDDHEIDLIFKDIMGAANIASVIVNERKEAKPHMPVAGKAAPVPPGAQVATAAVSWKTPGVQLANSPSPGEAETPAKFEMHVELTDAQGQAVPSNELEVYPSDNSVVIKHNLTPSSPRELKALATVRPTEFGESQMRNETSLETVPLSISISTNPLPYHLDIQRSDRQEQRVLSFSVKMMDEKTGAAMNIVDFETNAWYAQSSECQLKIGEADPFSRTVDLRTDQRGAYRIEFVVTAVDSSTGEKVKLTRHATARV